MTKSYPGTLGNRSDAAVDTDTTGSVSGKLRGVVKLLVNLLSRWPASLGQKLAAGSFPVVLATDQEVLVGGDVNITGLTGLVDTNNSVSGSVAAGADLAGDWTDVRDQGTADISVSSDISGAYEIKLQWSDDEVTVRATEPLDWDSSVSAALLSVPTSLRYFRLLVRNNTGLTANISSLVIHRPGKTDSPAVNIAVTTVETSSRRSVIDLVRQPAFGEAQGVHADGDPYIQGHHGPLTLGVRNDADVAGASDGDYTPFHSNDRGELKTADARAIEDLEAIKTQLVAGLRAEGFNGVIKDNDGTNCTVKVAHLDMTTATTTDIVAAVANKKIRVIEYTVILRESVVTTINFATGTGTTRVTGSPLMHRFESGSAVEWQRTAPAGAFLFETGTGEALRVTQTGAADISVALVYIEVD